VDGPAPGVELVYYDGGRFPFKDREFDYVVCSHVIEHVADVQSLVSELGRVARRGYIEYPTIYYEYLYNFSVHLNFIKYRDGKLYYLAKADTAFNDFLPVQRFFYRSLEMGHSQLVDAFKHIMFEGFEWHGLIDAARAASLNDLVFDAPLVAPFRKDKEGRFGWVANRLKNVFGNGGERP
jgi:SAM-dependent methyltransferase